nr:hypothetical protein [Tanacetum cinerariifolium]
MSAQNKAQYFADIKVINCILQGIPDDIYNYVDAYPDAQQMWASYERLMQAARNYDPLALLANSHAPSSNSHASSSYCHSPQPYYVTRSSSVIDNDDDYQKEIQGDAQEDKLTTAMMNQAVIQDGHVDIQSKNVGYAWNANWIAGRRNRNQATNAGNGLVQSIEEYEQSVQRSPRTKSTPGKTNIQYYNYNEKGHYARECPKPKENDFMLDNAYGDNTLDELNAAMIMMARIQTTNDKFDAKPTYDSEFISESHTIHHQSTHHTTTATTSPRRHRYSRHLITIFTTQPAATTPSLSPRHHLLNTTTGALGLTETPPKVR